MNYFNFKRYKFSTVSKYIANIGNNLLNVFKSVNFRIYDFKKIKRHLDITSFDFKYNFKKVIKHLDPKNYNINRIKKIKFFSSNFSD